MLPVFKSFLFRAGQYNLQSCFTRSYRILFIGSDNFSIQHLKSLDKDRHKKDYIDDLHVMVKSLKNPVSKYAEEHGLKILKWPQPLNWSHDYDLGVLVSFGNLLPDEFIKSFKRGVINVHPSILPQWRGSSPIMHQVLNGDQQVGVTIMKILPHEFDKGPVLMQKIHNLEGGKVSTIDLENILSSIGSIMLHDVLCNLDNCSLVSKSEIQSSYATKLSSKNAFVNWKEESMVHIERQYRALSHIWPLQTRWRNTNIRLLDKIQCKTTNALINEKYKDLHVDHGTCLFDVDRSIICINCKDGWVSFKRISYHKPMSAKDFNNGFLCKIDFIIFESIENNLKMLK